MAKSRVGLRGRSLVMLVLGGFVCVALIVVWRRSAGVREALAVQQLERKQSDLEGERARLESRIRDFSSRQTLGPIVEQRLGMHVPTEREVVILPREARRVSP